LGVIWGRVLPSLIFFLICLFCVNLLCCKVVYAEVLRRIDINSASIEELQELPGIGPKIAQRIIEYRKKYGCFKYLEELKKVKGIGEKKFEKIKSLIYLGVCEINKELNQSSIVQKIKDNIKEDNRKDLKEKNECYIYFYKDKYGVIHFTQFIESIPEEERNKVRCWSRGVVK